MVPFLSIRNSTISFVFMLAISDEIAFEYIRGQFHYIEPFFHSFL